MEFVALVIVELFHQLRRRVADVHRDREIAEFLHVVERLEYRVVRAAIFLALRKVRDAVR